MTQITIFNTKTFNRIKARGEVTKIVNRGIINTLVEGIIYKNRIFILKEKLT
jgi:hypothetical protein